MGLAWYIAVEEEVEGVDTFVEGKSIAHANEKKLDGICAKLGVKPLMDFFSVGTEEMLDLLDDDSEEVEDSSEVSGETWFEAEEGLVTVRALLEYLGAKDDELEGQESVVEDLEGYARILEALAKKSVRWHLAIDF